MIIKMHPSVQKVAEFMVRELPAAELRVVAEALALVAPVIWAHHQKHDIEPISMEEPAILKIDK
jgi:hypothetical protein